jgi:hypothetical protein
MLELHRARNSLYVILRIAIWISNLKIFIDSFPAMQLCLAHRNNCLAELEFSSEIHFELGCCPRNLKSWQPWINAELTSAALGLPMR